MTGVVGMVLFNVFSKRSRPYFARKMETVDAMIPWEENPEELLSGTSGGEGEPPTQIAPTAGGLTARRAHVTARMGTGRGG